MIALAVQLLPLGGPLLLSRDVYSYWAYGRMVWTHDANPYTSVPDRFPQDPATFVSRWSEEGPTHHVALGVGHVGGLLEKVGYLLEVQTVRVDK